MSVKKPLITDTPKLVKFEFDSWEHFVEYVDKGESVRGDISNRASHKEKTGSWTKETYYEAIEIAKSGLWKYGADKILKVSEPIKKEISRKIEHENFVFDKEGIGIDVSKFLNNEPECWMKTETEIVESENRINNRLIHITFNCSQQGDVESSQVFNRGSAVVSLVELLEYAGHRVKLDLVRYNKHNPWSANEGEFHVHHIVPLKDYDQPIDVGRISFALCNSSTNRRLMFAACEKLIPESKREYISGYGGTPDSENEIAGDIHLPRFEYGFESQAAVTEWVIEKLKEQGVHLHEEEVKY